MRPPLRSTPFLVLANKRDLRGAATVDELAQALAVRPADLPEGTCCAVRGACTLKGDGVVAGLDWIATRAADPERAAPPAA